jgi:hypothetical protein
MPKKSIKEQILTDKPVLGMMPTAGPGAFAGLGKLPRAKEVALDAFKKLIKRKLTPNVASTEGDEIKLPQVPPMPLNLPTPLRGAIAPRLRPRRRIR